MENLPTYPAPLLKPRELTAVEKSIAKPSAFAKAGTMGKKEGTRFRPLQTKRTPGRQRLRKPDPRKVHYF